MAKLTWRRTPDGLRKAIENITRKGTEGLAAGGVNHQTVKNFIRAGAVALGAGAALIPREFIQYRQADRIREFAPKLV